MLNRFLVILIVLLSVASIAEDHASWKARNAVDENQERAALLRRFCSESSIGTKYAMSAVLYNNRDDFRKAGGQHLSLFLKMGVSPDNTESVPFDVPLLKDTTEQKALLTRLKNLSDKILKEKRAGKPELTIIISSHGNKSIIARQNSSGDDDNWVADARSRLEKAREELRRARISGDNLAIKKAEEFVQKLVRELELALGSDENYKVVDEAHVPWQNLLDIIYDNIDPSISLNLVVEACHSGSLLDQLRKNPTNRYWNNRDLFVMTSNAGDRIGLGNIFLENLLSVMDKPAVDRCALIEASSKIQYRAVKPPEIVSENRQEHMLRLWLSSLQEPAFDSPHIWHSSLLENVASGSLEDDISTIFPNGNLQFIPSSAWMEDIGKRLASSHDIPGFSEDFVHQVGKASLGSWSRAVRAYFESSSENVNQSKTRYERMTDFRKKRAMLPLLGGTTELGYMAGALEWDSMIQDPEKPYHPGKILLNTVKEIEKHLQEEKSATDNHLLFYVVRSEKDLLDYFLNFESTPRGYLRQGTRITDDTYFRLSKLMSDEDKVATIRSIELAHATCLELLKQDRFKHELFEGSFNQAGEGLVELLSSLQKVKERLGGRYQ